MSRKGLTVKLQIPKAEPLIHPQRL